MREVEELAQMGVDCVIFFATFPGYPPMKMLPTWQMRAEQVMPCFRGARATM